MKKLARGSAWPPLVGEPVDAVLPENDVVEERDPEQLAGVAQPLGQNPILGARRGIAGGVVVGACDVKSL